MVLRFIQYNLKMKTIYQLAETMSVLDHMDLAREVLVLKDQGLWPKHAPQYNNLCALMMIEGYTHDIIMTMVINYIQEYALRFFVRA